MQIQKCCDCEFSLSHLMVHIRPVLQISQEGSGQLHTSLCCRISSGQVVQGVTSNLVVHFRVLANTVYMVACHSMHSMRLYYLCINTLYTPRKLWNSTETVMQSSSLVKGLACKTSVKPQLSADFYHRLIIHRLSTVFMEILQKVFWMSVYAPIVN